MLVHKLGTISGLNQKTFKTPSKEWKTIALKIMSAAVNLIESTRERSQTPVH